MLMPLYFFHNSPRKPCSILHIFIIPAYVVENSLADVAVGVVWDRAGGEGQPLATWHAVGPMIQLNPYLLYIADISDACPYCGLADAAFVGDSLLWRTSNI